jgi:RHS repeat-associated protein
MKRNSGVNTPNEQGGKGSQKISQKAMSQSNERPLSASFGNVAFLVYNNGVVLEKCSYDAFGRPKVTDPDGGHPRSFSYYAHGFLFQGREYIRELGVYDYRNRFYHPATGRFLQTDSTGFDAGDMNLFRYCHDDPVDGSDPMGLTDIEISAEEIRLGVQAALNARANLIKYPEKGPGRAQFVVPGPNGHPMLEKQFSTGEERVPVYRPKRGSNTSEKAGEIVTEKGPKNRILSGHVHDDAGVTGPKADREYTTHDRKEADGSAATRGKPAQPGHPVFKSYSSGGSKVDYLVPQTEPGKRASEHTSSTNGSTGQSDLTAKSVDIGPDPSAFMSLSDGYDASFQRFSK